MSRRISNWNFFDMVNVCLLMLLMVTAVPTSSDILRIRRTPRFRRLRNHGFGDFTSPFPNVFSIIEQVPGMRQPKALSIGESIPRFRQPGQHRGNRINGFDLHAASSFQENSYSVPPPSFQSNFNPTKPVSLPSSSSLFVTGLPKGYKPSSDIFDEEESISIGKLEAFLIHGDGEKPNPGNFEVHMSQHRPHILQKQRLQPTKKPVISESLKLLDHGTGTNFRFPNSLQDIHKNNHEFKPKRKPNNFLPPFNPLETHLRHQQERPSDTLGERIRHIPLVPPISRPKELHIIIHNAPQIQQSPPKHIPPHLPEKEQNYGTQRKHPLQIQYDTGHSSIPIQTQLSLPQKHNHQLLQVAPNNNRSPQVSNVPSSHDTRQETTLLIQPNFASSLTPQVSLLPPSSASNPNLQLNTGIANHAASTQPHPQITYNRPTIHQLQNTHPVQQQTAPVVQLSQGVHGSQRTQQNSVQNYVPTSQNDKHESQQNLQGQQTYVPTSQNDKHESQQNLQGQQTYVSIPQNTQQNYIPTLQDGQPLLQNTQQNYFPALQNGQVLAQNTHVNYIPKPQYDPSILQQNGPPRPTSLVSSAQPTHVTFSQNAQPGHSASVQYKEAVSVQQVNPSQQTSTSQYKQVQQTYYSGSQNVGYSSASQSPASSAQLSPGGISPSAQSSLQQNGPTSTVPQSYISTSASGQISYEPQGGTRQTHFDGQQDYAAAPQKAGVQTAVQSTEHQSYTVQAQPQKPEKHRSQTFSVVQSTPDQKSYSSDLQGGQFYSATNQQDAKSYAPATKPITFTINPSPQTTAKYVIVAPSGNANNAENNAVYGYKPQAHETQAASSSSTGYVTPGTTYNKDSSARYVTGGTTYNKDSSARYVTGGTTYNKDSYSRYITGGTTYGKHSSSGYVTPGSTYSKDLSDERHSGTSYSRHPSSTSVSSSTVIKTGGEGADEEFDEEESTNNSSYKVVYIPLDILKNFLTKGADVNNE